MPIYGTLFPLSHLVDLRAFYDRGSTLPLTCSLTGGVPKPQIVGTPTLFLRGGGVFVNLGDGIFHRDTFFFLFLLESLFG